MIHSTHSFQHVVDTDAVWRVQCVDGKNAPYDLTGFSVLTRVKRMTGYGNGLGTNRADLDVESKPMEISASVSDAKAGLIQLGLTSAACSREPGRFQYDLIVDCGSLGKFLVLRGSIELLS